MDRTVLLANFTVQPYLRQPRKGSPDGVTIDWGGRHLIAAYYLFIDPKRMKGWHIADGLTHISGHPSAVKRAQDSESSPVKNRRSTIVPRNQPKIPKAHFLSSVVPEYGDESGLG